ncbi:hypothetical protein RRG08_016509 [Elysia crispata]|uniref:Uncharacterized protein n=1 Tax=Elysia crispata TaxID=231223 RepID=A0AAE0Y8X4_9GAST|nr:hypothetical protein RRG08_016509 [Elysia crispata]
MIALKQGRVGKLRLCACSTELVDVEATSYSPYRCPVGGMSESRVGTVNRPESVQTPGRWDERAQSRYRQPVGGMSESRVGTDTRSVG